jgi:dTDP-4-amino-4,6-dideoxygalactose transaminase
VDFVDIDAETYNMSIPALEAKLAEAERDGALPKVVIPVHFSGQPADLVEIAGLGRRYGFRIIEDASHAVGATYRNSTIGDCSHSDIVIFSFHPVKIITSGEGGMALTNDKALADRMARLRSHGITRDASLFAFDSPGPWYYEQIELGFNYRMIELEAALGLSQFARLDHFLDRRNEIAAAYDRQLAGLPIVRPVVRPDRRSSFHLYVVRLPEPNQARHRAVFEAMRAAGIGVNLHYLPVHLQPDFRPLGFAPGMFPVAEAYADAAISLPIFPDLREEDQRFVVEKLAEALEGTGQ